MQYRMKIRWMCLLMGIIFNTHIEGEGFVAGTLVKTPGGYTPIEQLNVNDRVVSYDFYNAALIQGEVAKVYRKKVRRIVQLTVNNFLLETTFDHKFYCPVEKRWIQAIDLEKGHFLLTNDAQSIQLDGTNEIEKEIDVYCLLIQNQHNFFVSEQDVLVHNFAVPILAPIIAWIAAHFHISIGICLGGIIIAKKGLTNKEARKKAKEWGYVEDRNPPFNSHNKPAFKDPKRNVWISPDADGHNGGVWKEFVKDRRSGTLDKDGKIIKG